MIRLKQISKAFKDGEIIHPILQGIHFTIKEKDFITIMGPSGCGKSTLLNIVGLLTEPSSGEVYFDQMRVDYKKEKELERLRREKIGLIFQNANLISCLTPLENIVLAMHSKKSETAKRREALELLDMVGIKDRSHKHVKSLSGGEAQRVAIVRALANRPHVLLCDEPTGALDRENGDHVLKLLLDTRRQSNCAIVIVTHDHQIGAMGERQIVLNGGRILGVDQAIQAV